MFQNSFQNPDCDLFDRGEVETAAERLDDLRCAVRGIGVAPWLTQEEVVERILSDFPLHAPQISTLRGHFDHLDTRIRTT